ncbi:MAG TPA: FixG Ig-like domain-containing protein, partial [Ferruginibacter sp.]|nr:FixG Ig-like domain-containing protein [Ferruginibacter sp.]
VLLDKNSIVVAYDHKRGEPRGKLKKNEDHDCKCVDCKEDGACKSITAKLEAIVKQGDCIDCFACVRVCPTGIDIRNGTQLECVNCTACIDACDAIMTSIERPRGLIRYASENSITKGVRLKINTRIKAYIGVLMLLISLLAFLIVSRTDLDVRLMRTAGMTYNTLPDGRITNLFNLKLANKTHKDIDFVLKLENVPGEIELVGSGKLTVKKEAYTNLQFFLKLKKENITGWKTMVKMGVYENGKKIKNIEAKFIGPEVYN